MPTSSPCSVMPTTNDSRSIHPPVRWPRHTGSNMTVGDGIAVAQRSRAPVSPACTCGCHAERTNRRLLRNPNESNKATPRRLDRRRADRPNVDHVTDKIASFADDFERRKDLTSRLRCEARGGAHAARPRRRPGGGRPARGRAERRSARQRHRGDPHRGRFRGDPGAAVLVGGGRASARAALAIRAARHRRVHRSRRRRHR